MHSPFPGLDPFLEDQGYWKEFHTLCLTETLKSLAERVPDAYEVRIVERLTLVVEEVSEARIGIRRFPDRELVTAIEWLSPSNKEAPGESLDSRKRLELIHRPVHLVELDPLIGGKRLAMDDELPNGHYFALISRAERRFLSDTFAWTIRDPLPIIPIPLVAPDLDIPLDLAAIFNSVYRTARYERTIDYQARLSLPLGPEDRAWAETIARDFHPRKPH